MDGQFLKMIGEGWFKKVFRAAFKVRYARPHDPGF